MVDLQSSLNVGIERHLRTEGYSIQMVPYQKSSVLEPKSEQPKKPREGPVIFPDGQREPSQFRQQLTRAEKRAEAGRFRERVSATKQAGERERERESWGVSSDRPATVGAFGPETFSEAWAAKPTGKKRSKRKRSKKKQPKKKQPKNKRSKRLR